MPSDFSQLKKKRNERFDQLKDKIDNMDKNATRTQDERFWKPEVDKSGNGFAIIRFLDAPKGEDDPYVRLFSHAFEGPKGWYFENSLTTIGKPDPVSDYNRRLWNSGIETDKDIARNQKRKLSYIANIYVVKDPAHPENEGKVFLYRFGKRIFDKIKDKLEPEFEDEQRINVFDFWEGCNFRLKIRNVAGYRNYDKSEFDAPSAVLTEDEEIEKLWLQEHSLKEFVADDQFKSYDELKKQLDRALGFDTGATELHRPGDMVAAATPESHETAQAKIQEKIENPNAEEEVPGFDLSENDDGEEDTSEEDDDYYKNLVDQL